MLTKMEQAMKLRGFHPGKFNLRYLKK